MHQRPAGRKPPEPTEAADLDAFWNFVHGITQGRGGASTANIVFAIANLADTRGLWTYSDKGCTKFSAAMSSVGSDTLADFCRKNPERATLQEIPGVGPELAKAFKRAGYPTVQSVLEQFCAIASLKTRAAVDTAVVLDRFFNWVKEVQSRAKAPVACSHTVVHCVSELAAEINLITLDARAGSKYDQKLSNATAASVADFIRDFDQGFGTLGDITDIKGIGEKSRKAFAKETVYDRPITNVETLLDKFMEFIY